MSQLVLVLPQRFCWLVARTAPGSGLTNSCITKISSYRKVSLHLPKTTTRIPLRKWSARQSRIFRKKTDSAFRLLLKSCESTRKKGLFFKSLNIKTSGRLRHYKNRIMKRIYDRTLQNSEEYSREELEFLIL